MKDFTGRDLKDGDIVWVSNGPKFGEIGTFVDSSLRTMTHIRKRQTSGCIYLLENPTKEEIKKKQEILAEYQKYVEEKREKARERNRQKKEYGTKVGGVYSAQTSQQWVYLGNLEMVVRNEIGTEIKRERGNVYLQIPYKYRVQSGKDIEKLEIDDLLLDGGFDVLKGHKCIDGFLGVHPDLRYDDFRYVLGKHPIIVYRSWNPSSGRVVDKIGEVQFMKY